MQVSWNKGLKGVQIAWNRGLTKYSDPRVAKYSAYARLPRPRGYKRPPRSQSWSDRISLTKKNSRFESPFAVFFYRIELERLMYEANVYASKICGKKNKHNKLETAVANMLSLNGYTNFTTNTTVIKHYSADIFFPTSKIVMFVDGCFWHGCETCYGSGEYTIRKNGRGRKPPLLASKVREKDRRITADLFLNGYTVIHVWEHEFKENPFIVLTLLNQSLRLT